MGIKNLFVFVLFVPSILCSPTVKEDVHLQKCTDPTFACQDLDSARLCGVVSSCIHDIWSTMSAPDDDDDICQVCKEMVKEARDQLLSNMTQEEIKEVFEGSCKLLPVKLVADACIKAVDEFIPQLVEMLASRMDPNMVCTVSGLCNLAHVPVHGIFNTMKSFFTHQSKLVNKCDQCTSLLSDVKKIVAGISKEEFGHYVEGMIKILKPDFEYEESLRFYTNFIHTVLPSMKPKSVCSATKFCPFSCVEDNKPKDDLVCEFCTNVIHHVQDLITTNTTAEEFRRALSNFCKDVGRFSDKCTELVNEYFDTLFAFIRTMNPKSLCTVMSLCGTSSCSSQPLVKVIPAIATGKRVAAVRLTPALPVTNEAQDHPVVKVFPPYVPKKIQEHHESETTNEIFGNSNNQLLDKFSHPLGIFQQSLECNFCKAISFYLKTDLKDEVNEESVKNALSNVCAKWAVEYPGYCRSFLLKYSSVIKLHIIKNSDFTSLCHNVKACLASDKPELEVKEFKDDSVCDLCKSILTDIENQLKDPSVKKDVEKSLYQICNYLPKSFQPDCKNFINDNIDNIFKVLIQELDGDNLCPTLHLCSNKVKNVVSPHVKDLECDMCKTFVQQIQDKLENPEVKESFKELLDKVCTMLPGDIKNQCEDFVSQNIDTLVNIIVQELNPNIVCSAFSLCPKSAVLKPVKKIKNLECDLCEEVIHELEEKLVDGATEEEIKNALDKVCSHFPTSFATKCQNFVDQYSSLIVSLLAKELEPKLVCSSLNICSASVIVKPKPVVKPKVKVSNLECDLCKEVVQQLDEKLKNGATEEEIKDALEKVCSYFPSAFSIKCKTFVDQYSELLVTILAEELDPDMVCASLNVCPAKDMECEGCQYLFHFIQQKLMDGDYQVELKGIFKHVCERLPDAFSENCVAFVDEFGSQLLVLFAHNLDPSVLCPELHICPKAYRKHSKPKTIVGKEESLDKCSVCTSVVDYMDKLLEEDDIDKELTTLVERICTVVPSSQSDKCAMIIETYGPYLLQMIGQLANSKQVCQEIDMCPRVPGHVHLLGGRKCTFGPSYWCQSKLHASACKAEIYCIQNKQNAWKE